MRIYRFTCDVEAIRRHLKVISRKKTEVFSTFEVIRAMTDVQQIKGQIDY